MSLSTPHTAAASGSLNASDQVALNDDDVAATVVTAAQDHNDVDDNDDVDVDVESDSELSDSTESSHSTSLSESEGSR